MNKINVVDEVQLKQDFKNLYKDIGYEGMIQVLYELVFSVNLCLTVIREELENERNKAH